MSTEVKLRRGTTLEHDSFTGAPGELTIDTDLDELRLHNGVDAGGKRFGRNVFTSLSEALSAKLRVGDIAYIGEYVTDSGVGGGKYKKVSVNPGNNLINPVASDGNWLMYILNDSGYINPTQAGADPTGVIDSTLAIRACVASGFPVLCGAGEFKLSLAASEDAGNDAVIQFNSDTTTSKVFIGSGKNTVFKLDSASSFAGSFDIFSLDLRDTGEASFRLGNFLVEGEKASAPVGQESVGMRLQAGTTNTADYDVSLLPVWFNNMTDNGLTFGANTTFFDTIVSTNCDGHGASIRNTTGDGREIEVYGNSIIVNGAGKNAFDYSGDSQVNQGPCKSHIGVIDGIDCEFGVKIAGNHELVLDRLKLKGTKQLAAFRTNVAVSFRSANVGYAHIEDSAVNAVSMTDGGYMHIGRLVSINSATGDDILHSAGTLIIDDFRGEGGGPALESAIRTGVGAIHTDISISKLENYGSDPAGQFPIDIRGDSFCRISGGFIGDQKTEFHIIRIEQTATGSLHLNDFDIKGGGAATKAINQVAGDLGNTYLTNFNALKCTGVPSIVEAGAIPLHRNTVLAAVGMQQFANNAAAIVGGLLTGDEYGVTGSDPLQKAEVF